MAENTLLEKSGRKQAVYSLVEKLTALKGKAIGSILQADVFYLKGRLRKSGSGLASIFIGEESAAYYFAYLIYEQKSVKKIGKIFLRQIPLLKVVAWDVDLIFLQTEREFLKQLQNKGFTVMPKINFIMDLTPQLNDIFERLNRRRKRDIKTVLQQGYSFEIATTDEKLDLFYHKMYLPFIKGRYREAATCDPITMLRRLYHKGGILFVKKENVYVAGILFYHNNRTVYCHCIGIYEGNPLYVQNAAGVAALYFLIGWAKERGFAELDYGPNRPFLKEGIFTYKKEWGMFAREQKNQSIYALKVCKCNNGVFDFLRANPFIFVEDCMKGAIFEDRELTEQDLTSVYLTHFVPEMKNIIVVSFLAKPASRDVYGSPAELPKSLQCIADIFSDGGYLARVRVCKDDFSA